MAFSDTEFIDSNVFDFVQWDRSIEHRKPFFVDFFDQIPSDAQILGNGANSAKLKKIKDSQGKGPDIAVLAIHKWKCRPPDIAAVPALESVEEKVEEAPFSADGTHSQKFPFVPFKGGLPSSAAWTFYVLIRHPGADHNAVFKIAGCFVLDTFQTESVVQYRRGHGSASPPVRLASNKWGSCHVHFLFSTLRYPFAG
jgi:hypothetical protein